MDPTRVVGQSFKHSSEFLRQMFTSQDTSITVSSALVGKTKLWNENFTAVLSDCLPLNSKLIASNGQVSRMAKLWPIFLSSTVHFLTENSNESPIFVGATFPKSKDGKGGEEKSQILCSILIN